MIDEAKLDESRRKALARADSAGKAFWVLFALTALTEGVLLVLLLWHVDWGDPVQRVVALAAFLVYITLGMALLALGAYTRWWALRIVRAIDLG